MDQQVRGEFIQLALTLRVRIQYFLQASAAEVAKQEQPLREVPGEDFRRAETGADQPLGNCNERPWVLMRRRRVHQHGAALAMDDAKVSAERSVSRERQNLGPFPAGSGKEIRSMRWRNHWGGHRPSHDGGTLAVKILAPPFSKSSDKRSASGQACSPARSGHSTIRIASTAESRPSSSISDASSTR